MANCAIKRDYDAMLAPTFCASAFACFETKSGKLFQTGRTMTKALCAVAALAATISLAGCMSSGTDVSDQKVDQFVRGQTTESEVIAALGQPDEVDRSSDGERVDMYTYTKARANAQSFIPLIGPFIASMDTKTKIVRFTFYKNGILKDWTSSGRATTINEGYANQK